MIDHLSTIVALLSRIYIESVVLFICGRPASIGATIHQNQQKKALALLTGTLRLGNILLLVCLATAEVHPAKSAISLLAALKDLAV